MLATCTLGLGFSYSGFEAGLNLEPHAIACDAGSADFGPYYLGSGQMQKSRRSVKRDLELLICGARKINVPFMTGSAGGAGADVHVEGTAEIAREIAATRNLRLRLALISAEVSREWLEAAVKAGRIAPLDGGEPLTLESISRLSLAVAMMGVEPFQRALDMDAQVIIAGRSTDPAIFAGVPLRMGLPASQAWHAAKSIDKGYLATTQPSQGSPVLARIRPDHFLLEPTQARSRCDVASVASLTLHENPNPFEVRQPSGTIDTHQTVYEQVDDRCVKVSGSRFIQALNPTLKVEGAELVGYRTILVAGIRDPRLLERLDEFLEVYRETLRRVARSLDIAEQDYVIQFRVYGRDAVMGSLEPLAKEVGHEVGLIIDCVGRTEEIAGAIGSRMGPTGSRLDITGKLGGGGNFAYPFSPSLIKAGPVYRWSVWHLVDTDEREMTDLFRISIEDL